MIPNAHTKQTAGSPRFSDVSYTVQIDGCYWSYDFGTGLLAKDGKAYSESSALHVWGPLLSPTVPKVRMTRLRFFVFEVDFERPEGIDNEREMAGEIEVYQGVLTGSLVLPTKATPALVAALGAGKSRTLLLFGDRLRYRRANIDHYSLSAAEPDL